MQEQIRIRLQVSYDGCAYNGWQKQVDGSAVQNRLEKALGKLFQTEIRTVGSGRTDTGVHAFDQNVHFQAPSRATQMDLTAAINSLLPKDIVVLHSYHAPDDFHALASAERKIYEYRILQSTSPCPVRRNLHWHVADELSLELLQSLSNVLVGRHDFKSFQSSGTDVKSTEREIFSFEWKKEGTELVMRIEGNGFLKHMVRNIVGTLVFLALENDDPNKKLREILEARDRQKAAPPAPPQGLYLLKVLYPDAIIEGCREISRPPRPS